MSRNGEDEMTGEEIIQNLMDVYLKAYPAPRDRAVAVVTRARELLAKPVATREKLTDFLLSKGWHGRASDEEVTDILAALTHFAPPSPPPPEGLPSVENIEAIFLNRPKSLNSYRAHCADLARVARALLEKHGREKRAIDGMTSNDIEIAIEIERSCNHKHIPCNPHFAEMASKVAYRLATTPAPVAPKVDPDAGAKKIFSILHASGEIPWTWENVLDETRDACRTLARHSQAKQVKP